MDAIENVFCCLILEFLFADMRAEQIYPDQHKRHDRYARLISESGVGPKGADKIS